MAMHEQISWLLNTECQNPEWDECWMNQDLRMWLLPIRWSDDSILYQRQAFVDHPFYALKGGLWDLLMLRSIEFCWIRAGSLFSSLIAMFSLICPMLSPVLRQETWVLWISNKHLGLNGANADHKWVDISQIIRVIPIGWKKLTPYLVYRWFSMCNIALELPQ